MNSCLFCIKPSLNSGNAIQLTRRYIVHIQYIVSIDMLKLPTAIHLSENYPPPNSVHILYSKVCQQSECIHPSAVILVTLPKRLSPFTVHISRNMLQLQYNCRKMYLQFLQCILYAVQPTQIKSVQESKCYPSFNGNASQFTLRYIVPLSPQLALTCQLMQSLVMANKLNIHT